MLDKAAIEHALPGASEMLEPWNFDGYGFVHKGSATDVLCVDGERFTVVAAKIEQHSWSTETSSGIEWTEWILLIVRDKQMPEAPLVKVETKKVTTRDMFKPAKDKTELWGYTGVHCELLDAVRIKTAWKNEAGATTQEQIVGLLNSDSNGQ